MIERYNIQGFQTKKTTDWNLKFHAVSFRAEFSVKVFAKRFTQNYCFQESGWLLFHGTSPDYLTHGFPVKAFCQNFNATLYYAEDTMVSSVCKFNVLFI